MKPRPAAPDSSPAGPALVDITGIRVNPDLPIEERCLEFSRKIGNPRCFLCGGFTVHASYAESSLTLGDCLKSLVL